MFSDFDPPWLLKNGLAMTLYTAWHTSRHWHKTIAASPPPYQNHRFVGAGTVPLFGLHACPVGAKGTIIGTYGITGDLSNQWFLQLLGYKAFAQNYGVILFDWRGHGKTAQLSPTLTSDGLREGVDFVHIAAQAKQMGYPAPFWFTGFSLGGQLALWGVKMGESLPLEGENLGLEKGEIAGGAVICPNLDSNRSLPYLMAHPLGRYVEQAITKTLKKMAWELHDAHPHAIAPAKIERIDSIWSFDRELVIERLGFTSVEDYYAASSPLPFLPYLEKPTLILYAVDDPLFDPDIIPDLEKACQSNPAITLGLTQYGGHVGYLSSKEGQKKAGDPDPWWAWNRVLDFIEGN